LKQAVYQPENRGHFGLGYESYTHFTSPIRRYPDLLIHRALCYLIRKPGQTEHVRKASGAVALTKKSIYPYDRSAMELTGVECSMTERRADAATYDVIDWLKCEYIQDRVGDDFPGTISSVTGFGLFVELSDIYVEGLVHITDLNNDYYKFDPARHSLRGERSGTSYSLGDVVRVRVIRVDLDERKIDLHLMSEDKPNPKRASGKKSNKQAKGKTKAKKEATGRKKAGTTRDAVSKKSVKSKNARKVKTLKENKSNKQSRKGSKIRRTGR